MLKYIFALVILTCKFLYPQTDSSEFNRFSKEDVEEYIMFEGKVVRNINFRIIDVTGPAVEENNGSDTSWISGFVNSLHYTTREWVVNNYLLFKEGDTIDAIDISESERLLRESAFFLDSRIRIIPVENSDKVDVRVVTKDRWTLIPLLSLNPQKNSYAGIKDDNFLGLGHRIDGTITHNADPLVGWGSKITYTAFNVNGTYVDITGGFELNRKTSLKVLDVSRSFVSIKTRVAGGLNVGWNSSKFLFKIDDTSNLIPFSNFSFDLWGGYSFPVSFGPSTFRKRTNIIAAAAIKRSQFTERPYVSIDSNRVFANAFIYLLNTGIINKRYYRDHYIQRFGPTEDVPIGGMLSLTAGYDQNEFSKRFYTGAEAVYSRRLTRLGYVSFYAATGAYYRNKDWEQNVFNFDIIYHSKLFEQAGWRWRYFLQNKYLIGTDRLEQEQIFLDSENGLRGHERFALHGVSRALLKFETRFFTPVSILGFAFGLSGFVDLGLISDRREKIINSKVYQSYGAGLRIANESISSAQFDVQFVYVPFSGAKKSGDFVVLFSSNMVLGVRQFNFSKPTVIKYGEN